MSRRTLLLGAVAGMIAGTLEGIGSRNVPDIPVATAAALHAATSVNQHLQYDNTMYDSGGNRAGPSTSEQIIDLGVRCVRTIIPTDDQLGARAALVRAQLTELMTAGCDMQVLIPDTGDFRATLAYARSFFGNRIRLFE